MLNICIIFLYFYVCIGPKKVANQFFYKDRNNYPLNLYFGTVVTRAKRESWSKLQSTGGRFIDPIKFSIELITSYLATF